MGTPEVLSLPPSGHISRFLDELFSLQDNFSGVLRVTSSSEIAIVGLRGRTNERDDFLLTTTPPANELDPLTTADRFFATIADSGGWTTQFVLFSGRAGQVSSGALRFFDESGAALDLSSSAPTPTPEPTPENSPPAFPSTTSQTSTTQFQRDTVGRLIGGVTTVTVSTPATDPDGDPITYSWQATNGTVQSDGLTVTWTRIVSFGQLGSGALTLTASSLSDFRRKSFVFNDSPFQLETVNTVI